MREVGPPRCLLVEVRTADEPANHTTMLWPALQELMRALGDEPRTMWATSPGGKAGRDRQFSWAGLNALGSDPKTGTVSSTELRAHEAEFDLSIYLRHNPALPADAQPPAAIWMAVELRAGAFALTELVDAAESFLIACATTMPVLHGGVTVLDNVTQARCEVTGGTASEAAKQRPEFQRRREHDWFLNQSALWSKCRRLYFVSLLGPALAARAGGAEAARAAGAIDVREIAGALIFRAIHPPPRDSLDPEFLATTASQRRWLWPCTFQNPLDASGIEDVLG